MIYIQESFDKRKEKYFKTKSFLSFSKDELYEVKRSEKHVI